MGVERDTNGTGTGLTCPIEEVGNSGEIWGNRRGHNGKRRRGIYGTAQRNTGDTRRQIRNQGINTTYIRRRLEFLEIYRCC